MDPLRAAAVLAVAVALTAALVAVFSGTLRGYPINTISGPAALVLTGEIGTDLPLARLVLFGEIGWADRLERLLQDRGLAAIGGGLSIADGVLRIDMARGVSDGGEWRFFIATSGLL